MKALILLCLLSGALTATAQLKGFGLGPYAETAWPAGSFARTHQRGWGAGLGADINLPGKLGITGSAGYMRFGAGNSESAQGAVNAFPVRVGLKYQLPLVYFKLESGKTHIPGSGSGGWIIAPGIGVRVLGLDLQARYESWNSTPAVSFWGLKAGFQF